MSNWRKKLKKVTKKPVTNYKEDRKIKNDLIDIFHIKFKERQKKAETLKKALQAERNAILECLNKANSYLNSNSLQKQQKRFSWNLWLFTWFLKKLLKIKYIYE